MITLERATGTTDKFDCLSFFSQVSPAGRLEVAEMLTRMVATEEQLAWLEREMIDRVGVWRGTMELRAVFLSRWPAADGVDAWAQDTPGYHWTETESPATVREPYRLQAGDEPVRALAEEVREGARRLKA